LFLCKLFLKFNNKLLTFGPLIIYAVVCSVNFRAFSKKEVYMKKFSLLLSIPFLLIFSNSAFAIPFTMTNFGSDDVSSILASVVDISGGAKVTVNVSAGPIVADITGVFFDLDPYVAITIANPSYPFTQNEDSVQKALNNSNMGGSIPKFDVGVAIGDLGLTDDIQMVMFDVLGADASDFTRLGVRLQSVGSGSSRDGSAKYVGNPVPEPASVFLLGVGLVLLAAFGKRKILRQ
jgi:hypothetical protein